MVGQGESLCTVTGANGNIVRCRGVNGKGTIGDGKGNVVGAKGEAVAAFRLGQVNNGGSELRRRSAGTGRRGSSARGCKAREAAIVGGQHRPRDPSFLST